jgi:hypothetical protein
MPRQRLCRVCREWHNLDAPWPLECYEHRTPVARADFPTPGHIGDHMDPTQSMLDGKFYESKSALRATYRAAGVEEIGNDSCVLDPKPLAKEPPDRGAIRASVAKAVSRYNLTARAGEEIR